MQRIHIARLLDDATGETLEVHTFCSITCLDLFLYDRHPWDLPAAADIADPTEIINEAHCTQCFDPIFGRE